MRYVIGLGSNCEPRETHLINALNSLAALAESIYSSTHYESPAMGAIGKPHYLNAVAEIESSLTPAQLNSMLKQIEIDEGRDEVARAEGRVPLDADIVIAGKEVVRPKDFKQFFFRRGYEELRSNFEISPNEKKSQSE